MSRVPEWMYRQSAVIPRRDGTGGPELLLITSRKKKRWVLPKGKKALEELEQARRFWHLDARVEQSLTDPEAKIVLVDRAKRRGRR